METLRLTRDVTSLPENFWSQLDPPALAFATSGSTDEPRWIRHSREALLLSAAAVNRCFAVTPQDVWLRALPLFHVAGVGVEARANAAACRLVILQGGWDVVEFIKLVNHEKVTLTSLVPTQVFDLVQTGHAAPSSLRAVLVEVAGWSRNSRCAQNTWAGRCDPAMDSPRRPRRLRWRMRQGGCNCLMSGRRGSMQMACWNCAVRFYNRPNGWSPVIVVKSPTVKFAGWDGLICW